jgi:hypothetical protein
MDIADIDMELVGRLLPDAAGSRAAAVRLAGVYPGEHPVALAERATMTAQRRAALAGLGTGLIGNPVLLVPLCMADMALMIRTEAHLAGVVAALLDPASLDDDEQRQLDIYAMLFPDLLVELSAQRAAESAATAAVEGAAVAVAAADHKAHMRKRLGMGLGSATLKLIGKYIGLRFAGRSLLSKAMPFVGAAVGATLNYTAVRAVGERAIAYHSRRRDAAPEVATAPAEVAAAAG